VVCRAAVAGLHQNHTGRGTRCHGLESGGLIAGYSPLLIRTIIGCGLGGCYPWPRAAFCRTSGPSSYPGRLQRYYFPLSPPRLLTPTQSDIDELSFGPIPLTQPTISSAGFIDKTFAAPAVFATGEFEEKKTTISRSCMKQRRYAPRLLGAVPGYTYARSGRVPWGNITVPRL